MQSDSLFLNLTINTSALDAGLERLKDKLKELKEAQHQAAPQILLKSDRPLSMDAIERMRTRYLTELKSGRPIFMDGDVRVYQLVDGRWDALYGPTPYEPSRGAS